jgi:2'-5' RNA ligase
MTRLSVAVRPPADVAATLAALARPPVPGVIWALPDQWIVKVRPLGHVDEGLVPDLAEALRDALDGAPPARCLLGPATVRLAGQWLAVPVTGLEELGRSVFEATEPIVPVTHPQPFRTDVVLARGRVPADLAGAPVHASWQAGAVALVADRSAPGRPRLVDLAVVRLDG